MTGDVHPSRAKLATRLAFVVAGFGVAGWGPLVSFAKTRLHSACWFLAALLAWVPIFGKFLTVENPHLTNSGQSR
jgi:hypothetical protein